MKCPKCESDNTQRLQVAFQNGTQNIATTSRSVGIGIGSGGGLGLGLGRSKTSGQSQTMQAQQIAPPEKKPYLWPGIGAFVGLTLCSSKNEVSTIVIGLILLGICGYILYTRKKFNTETWPNLTNQWSESWICQKCGEIYHQPI